MDPRLCSLTALAALCLSSGLPAGASGASVSSQAGAVLEPAQSLPRARPFRMGFTPFPYDFTASALDDTYAYISRNADLICHHHDGGVPWTEALLGQPLPAGPATDIAGEVARTPPGHAVYVSATPQSTQRAGELAPYWGESTGMALPPFWEGQTLASPLVISAFTNWCRTLIDRLEPDYFAYAIECNGGFSGLDDPELADFLVLADQVYATLRTEYPGLPIFLTVQTGSTESPREEFLALTRQVLERSDWVAISSYPYLVLREGGFDTYGDPSEVPPDLLRSIVRLAPAKPFAISETGYIAEDLAIPEYGLFALGRTEWQAAYVDRLLSEATALEAEFVMWFVSRDYDPGLATLASLGVPIDPSFYVWRDNGLLGTFGEVRPAHDRWNAWLALPRRR